MKKLTLFLFIICFSIICFSQNIRALDEKYGFRNFKFETNVNEFNNLVLTEATNDSIIKFYKMSDDKLLIGTNELESITYIFFKDMLYGVLISVKGTGNCKGVLDTMRELYGKGTQPNQFMEKYSWHGNKVLASYDENSISNKATIIFMSVPLNNQEIIDKKEATKKAKDDM